MLLWGPLNMPKLQKHDHQWFWGDYLVATEGFISCAAGERLYGELLRLHSSTVTHNLAPVPGGDIVLPTVSGVVGVERKAPDDAIQSWQTGHLAEQLAIMLDHYDHTILLLEAPELWNFDYFKEPATMYWRWWDDLLTFQEAGVHLYFSRGLEHSAAVVLHLWKRYESTVHHALDKQRSEKGQHVYRRVLSAVPGWGPETARKALEVGPPYKVIAATPTELEHHINPRSVRLLFEAFGRRIHAKRGHNT